MREILFRGKIRGIIDWVYGYYCNNGYADFILMPSDEEEDNFSIIDRETVGQYTGLKDKNGVKIFEGDIVRCTDEADEFDIDNSDCGEGVVEWVEKWGFWNIEKIENGLADIINYGFVEVIGNIHDNPELLEV